MQVSKKRSNNTSHRVFDLYHNIHHHNTIPATYRDHHLLFLKVQSDTPEIFPQTSISYGDS